MDDQPELDPDRARELAEGGDAQLIDVRTAEERAEGALPGALAIELSELSERAEELDRDRPVILYCQSGTRSEMARDALRSAGYDAYSIAGGLDEWTRRGFPVEPGVD